jgi:hypothetical protein
MRFNSLPILGIALILPFECLADNKLLMLSDHDLDQAITQDTKQFQSQARSLGQSLNRRHSIQSSRCQQLSQQVNENNGKPQLMYIARQRHATECLSNY